jgi:hypothetical protein
MLNRIYIVGVLSLLILFSCKKDESQWDREIDLVVDTLTCQIRMDYTVQSINQVDIQIEMLTINGLESEVDYSGQTFTLSPNNYSDYSLNFTNSTVIQETPITDYTAVLLFQNSGDWWFEGNRVGIYLRRYLELYGNTRNIATAYFDYGTDESVEFSNKNGGSYFDNNWEDDINKYYREMKTQNDSPDNVPFQYFYNRLNETMDSLIINYSTSPNKSITVFLPTYYYNPDDLLYESVWNKANANNIQINFIGNSFTNLRQIAYETGGFVIENYVDPINNVLISDYEKYITPVGVTLENLDNILSKNYTIHSTSLSLNSLSGSFFSGNILYVRFIYQGFEFAIDIRLP